MANLNLTQIKDVIVETLINHFENQYVIDDYDGELEDLLQSESVVPKLPAIYVLLNGYTNQEDSGTGTKIDSIFRTNFITVVSMAKSLKKDKASATAYELLDGVETALQGQNLSQPAAQAIRITDCDMIDATFKKGIVAYTQTLEWEFLREITQ